MESGIRKRWQNLACKKDKLSSRHKNGRIWLVRKDGFAENFVCRKEMKTKVANDRFYFRPDASVRWRRGCIGCYLKAHAFVNAQNKKGQCKRCMKTAAMRLTDPEQYSSVQVLPDKIRFLEPSGVRYRTGCLQCYVEGHIRHDRHGSPGKCHRHAKLVNQ